MQAGRIFVIGTLAAVLTVMAIGQAAAAQAYTVPAHDHADLDYGSFAGRLAYIDVTLKKVAPAILPDHPVRVSAYLDATGNRDWMGYRDFTLIGESCRLSTHSPSPGHLWLVVDNPTDSDIVVDLKVTGNRLDG